MKHVAIVQTHLLAYRLPFYRALYALLDRRGIHLDLIYSRGALHNSGQLNQVSPQDLPWATIQPCWNLPGDFRWRPPLPLTASADLVIAEDAIKNLDNLVYLARSHLGGAAFALWGHGWNRHSKNPDGVVGCLKHILARRAHWYFAYTETVKDGLVARGFDPTRITAVQNTIAAPSGPAPGPESILAWRQEWQIPAAAFVVLYIGGLYTDKRLGELIQALDLMTEELDEAHLVIAGDGPERQELERAAGSRPKLHVLGPVYGAEKDLVMAAADVCAIPSAVGLAVVDCFHHGLPLVTTRSPHHGPEVDYIVDGVNGVLIEEGSPPLAATLLRLAGDKTYRAALAAAARETSSRLSMNAMVERFAAGVEAALGATASSSSLP